MREQFIAEAKKAIMAGSQEDAEEVAQRALSAGMDPVELLEQGFIPAITEMVRLPLVLKFVIWVGMLLQTSSPERLSKLKLVQLQRVQF